MPCALWSIWPSTRRPVACLDGDCKGCSRSDECPTLDVWKNLDKLINDYLDGVTLDALVAPNEGYDYVI